MLLGLQRKMVASRVLDRSVGCLFAGSFTHGFLAFGLSSQMRPDPYDGDGEGDGCRPHLLPLAVMSLVSLFGRFWFRGVMSAAF